MNPWFVTIFAAIAVIVGGWFLGQALARVFNGPPKGQSVAQAPTPLPIVTPPASASPAPTPEQTVTPTEKPTPAPAPSVAPEPSSTPAPKPVITPAQTAPATPAPSPTEQSTPVPTLAPAQASTQTPAPARSATAPPASEGETPAAHIVRAYINALRHGDPATASSYLGNGAPDESFIDSATHISSITSTPNDDGSYKVEVDMRTSQGAYFETFTVASGKILEKTAIKP
jgi:cytoskeletal protein RodZ